VFEELSLEVYLEYKDPDVDVRVCRTLDGHPPRAWRMHEGQRIRFPLHEALTRGSDADRALAGHLLMGLRRFPSGKPEAMMPAIQLYADVLREAIDRIPSYYDKLFLTQE
jgi:hypothetical protein